MRYAPTVFRLISNHETHDNTSKIIPFASIHNRTCVWAYRIRPPRRRITIQSTTIGDMHRRNNIIFANVRAYAIRPYSYSLKSNNETNKNTSKIGPTASIHKRTCVGAYRIRPSRQRIRSHSTNLVTIQRQITPN